MGAATIGNPRDTILRCPIARDPMCLRRNLVEHLSTNFQMHGRSRTSLPTTDLISELKSLILKDEQLDWFFTSSSRALTLLIIVEIVKYGSELIIMTIGRVSVTRFCLYYIFHNHE